MISLNGIVIPSYSIDLTLLREYLSHRYSIKPLDEACFLKNDFLYFLEVSISMNSFAGLKIRLEKLIVPRIFFLMCRIAKILIYFGG